MKKITLATIKSFINKNRDNLYIKVRSSFDGMTDCVEVIKDAHFSKIENTERSVEHTMGINGAWFVSQSRDYFGKFDYAGSDGVFEGYEISNCCGTFQLAIKK
jgi:hypothetical protein